MTNLCGASVDFCNQATCQPQYTAAQLCEGDNGPTFWEQSGQSIFISIVSSAGAALVIAGSAKLLQRRWQLQRGDPIGSEESSRQNTDTEDEAPVV